MARPTASVTPALMARLVSAAGREGPAPEQFAAGGPSPRATRGTPPRATTAKEPASDTPENREFGPYAAQRLSQERVSDTGSRLQLPRATAAYHKALETHVQILSSNQSLDLRI